MRSQPRHLHLTFQSTPPARGATALSWWAATAPPNFNPRPPRGGRRREVGLRADRARISIHAPREGGDFPDPGNGSGIVNFNPRPPRGGRPTQCVVVYRQIKFQSTPPARGATLSYSKPASSIIISIHAPREGGDCAICAE